MSRAGRNARRWYMLKGGGYVDKVLGIDRDNLILYHPMNEPSGGVAIDKSPEGNDGAYTGVTLGQPGIGDGNTCPFFDGANDYNNIYSAGLNADWNGGEFTIAMWAKVNAAGIWTNGIEHELIRLFVNGSNFIYIRKPTTNNTLQMDYSAGGTFKRVADAAFSETGFFHIAVTVSKTADAMNGYINGVVTADSPQSGLGTFAGAIGANTTVVGAIDTTPTSPWHGWLAHPSIWKVALSAPQIARLATV